MNTYLDIKGVGVVRATCKPLKDDRYTFSIMAKKSSFGYLTRAIYSGKLIVVEDGKRKQFHAYSDTAYMLPPEYHEGLMAVTWQVDGVFL